MFQSLVELRKYCRGHCVWLWTPCGCHHGLQVLCLPLAETARREIGRLHFPALGAALTVFAQEHPSSFLPDVVVFHEPVLLQLDLLTYWNDTTAYKDELYLFSKELDEEVAKLHIPALGAELTLLTQEHAD